MTRITLFLVCALSLNALSEKLTLEALTGGVDLSGPTLRTPLLSPDGKRVTFLKGKESDRFQLDLWETDVQTSESRLLVDSKVLSPNQEVLSDEEKARRERTTRGIVSGIVEYQWAPNSNALLFPLAGKLYLFDLEIKLPRRLEIGEGFAIDPKMSPQGKYVSFIRDRNLWVFEFESNLVRQLTFDKSETIANGVAEFIAQEEMDRQTGYWWAEDDSAIAFTRTDESHVPIQKRTEIYADRSEVVSQRYPSAGETNVHIQLGVISPNGGETHWIDLGTNPDIYLARVDWVDNARVSFQRQSRDQRTLDLIVADYKSGAQKTLVTEHRDTWINLNDDLRFLKNGDFIWASERTGYKHLYLYDQDGKLKRPLTLGAFVVESLLEVDEDKRVAYVASTKESALEKHIYIVPLSGGDMVRLSLTPGMHTGTFSKNASVYLDAWSNTKTPPKLELHASNGRLLSTLVENELKEGHPYFTYWAEHRETEFGTLKSSDGQNLYYSMTKPSGFDPKKKYPVLVQVYGGPHVQMVNKGWNLSLRQYLAQHGYVVFVLDNRGSARRGTQFEDVIFRKMGGPEVDDQARGVHFLKSLPFVDASRVAVFGWSYGGYMTLRMLTKHPHDFACGIAGAPVIDWALYDTHYTEQFMDNPKINALGYKESSVFSHVDELSSKLLLMHGMADDNVLFTHSTQLMSKLQSRGFVFELMTYPGAKHGALNAPTTTLHAHKTIVDFLRNHCHPSSHTAR